MTLRSGLFMLLVLQCRIASAQFDAGCPAFVTSGCWHCESAMPCLSGCPVSQIDVCTCWMPAAECRVGSMKPPHVFGPNAEGMWFPEPGYTWANPGPDGKPVGDDWSVCWRSGIGYWHLGKQRWPHVVSSSVEGYWCPEPGFKFANLDSSGNPIRGSLAVVSIDGRRQLSPKDKELESHWVEYLKGIQEKQDYPNWSGPPYDLYLKQREQVVN
jgi:hypothetical protein